MQKYSVNEQNLAFDRVLPWEGQAEPLVWEGDTCYLQLAAGEAQRVECRIAEQTFAFTKENDGIWRMVYPFRDGIQYVQILVDGMEVITPLLPITYGYSRPYNFIALERKMRRFTVYRMCPMAASGENIFFLL